MRKPRHSCSPARCALLAGCLSLAAWRAFAAGSGTVASAFPQVGEGGRAVTMGPAYAAVVDDATALACNPARMTCLRNTSLAVSYTDLFGLGLVGVTSVRLVVPFGQQETRISDDGAVSVRRGSTTSALGIGVRSLSVDLEPESYTETDLSLGYAAPLAGGVVLGLAGHLLSVRCDLDGVGGNGYALDLAATRALPGGFSAAAVLRNALSSIKWDNETSEDLPMRFILAAAWHRDAWNLSIPVGFSVAPSEGTTDFSMGLAWRPVAGVGARAGFLSLDPSADASLASTFGLTLGRGRVAFDYGFVSDFCGLGATHHFTLRLGG